MANQSSKINKAKAGWVFLGVMLLIYSIAALIDVNTAKQSLLFFSEVFLQIVPILILVFVLMVLLNLFLTAKRIQNYLGQSSGLKGWFLTIAGGILSSGPIYPWYVLLGDLRQQGMKTSLVAVFLYSRAVKLPLLPLLIHYFGLPYTAILSLYLICFSVLSGIVMGVLIDDG